MQMIQFKRNTVLFVLSAVGTFEISRKAVGADDVRRLFLKLAEKQFSIVNRTNASMNGPHAKKHLFRF